MVKVKAAEAKVYWMLASSMGQAPEKINKFNLEPREGDIYLLESKLDSKVEFFLFWEFML